MKKFCIVVPIYHEDIYDYEEISLKRLHDVIYDKGYDVFFIYPNGLNIDKYLELYNTANLISMDNDFFTDIHAYSQLMLNYNFYNMFSIYQYMLIYQTDSYLFKDEIEEWCNKGYDYIGAPIISGLKIWEQDNVNDWTPKVGNGGLSLRRIAIFKDITKNEKSLFLILINNNMKRIKRNGLLNYIKLAISIIAASMTLFYNTQEISIVMKYINISLLIVLTILYNKTFSITKSKNNQLTSIIGNNKIARENILKIKEELSEVK